MTNSNSSVLLASKLISLPSGVLSASLIGFPTKRSRKYPSASLIFAALTSAVSIPTKKPQKDLLPSGRFGLIARSTLSTSSSWRSSYQRSCVTRSSSSISKLESSIAKVNFTLDALIFLKLWKFLPKTTSGTTTIPHIPPHDRTKIVSFYYARYKLGNKEAEKAEETDLLLTPDSYLLITDNWQSFTVLT